jgi:hypothetical protein
MAAGDRCCQPVKSARVLPMLLEIAGADSVHHTCPHRLIAHPSGDDVLAP